MARYGRSGRREKQQDTWKRYVHAREDAQLVGLLPTLPEEVVKNKHQDRVKPTSEQDMTMLDRAAINQGWATPEGQRPMVIQRLLDKMMDPGTSTAEVVMCANALVKADQIQFARDNPELAGKAKGGTTLQITAVDIAEYIKRIKAQREIDVTPVLE